MCYLWRTWTSSGECVDVDFLNLCDVNVSVVENLVRGGRLLNQKQCQDLSTKLSQTTLNVRHLVKGAASDPIFRPALGSFYRYLDKARLLVLKCAEERWWEAAVFQMQNENAFREVLLEVGLCYHAIYELARSRSQNWNQDDLWQPCLFEPATDSDVREDERELRRRLEDVVNIRVTVDLKQQFKKLLVGLLMALALRQHRSRKECLATYLLRKLSFTLEDRSLRSKFRHCKAILWEKESEPEKTWQMCKLLGSGVYSAKWLGVQCAKKEFHGEGYDGIFFKEANILVRLRHPRVVSFFCCGNGTEKGDRFIAMELMEMDLAELIEERKGKYFSLPVVVDMMIQIAQGTRYLHDQGVAHRDLKPHNVVVNRVRSKHLEEYYSVKLVDFGVSKTDVEVAKSNIMTSPGIGTNVYRAPEAHPKASPENEGRGKVNWLKADAFSFGITCAHLLSLKAPFKGISVRTHLYNEVMFKGLRPELPSDFSQKLVELLQECWNSDPKLRPTFWEISNRLEIYRQTLLRGSPSGDMDSTFIQEKLEKHSFLQRLPTILIAVQEDVGEDEEGEALNSNNSGMSKEGNGEDSFEDTSQPIIHQNRLHALHTKYSKRIMHHEHGNLLTLLQCPHGKNMFSTRCNHGSKSYWCTSIKSCAFEGQGMRFAMGLKAFIPATSLTTILTNSVQHHKKAKLAYYLPTPRSCLRLV